jgi:DNA-directed RNA polymerase specialized sigma24 family protein
MAGCGDVDAVYRRYAERLRAGAAARANEVDAEDAVADAFLGLLEHGTRGSVWSYLYQRVYRGVRVDRAARGLRHDDAHPDAAELAIDTVALRQALSALPQEDQELAELRWSGYTLAEVAQTVRRPLSTVAERLASIRRRVGEHLSGYLLGGALMRRLHPAAEHTTAPLSLAVAVVVALAGLPASTDPGVHASQPAVGVAYGAVRTDALAIQGPGPRQADVVAVERTPAARPRAAEIRAATVTPGAGALLGRQETPQDTHLLSVASGGGYMVLLGQGRSCSCTVLFRSGDGGRSWEVEDGPARGTQVAVAPDYPADPRIAVGQPAGAAALDVVAPGWGRPFASLPAPPGPLAIAGGAVYVATATALLRIAGGVSVLMAYSQVSASAALVATPTGVVALAPPGAVVGAVPPPTSAAVWTCSAACTLLGAAGLPSVGSLAAEGRDVVASSGTTLAVSHDGGLTFAVTAAPGWIGSLAATASGMWAGLGSGVVLQVGAGVEAAPATSAVGGAEGRPIALLTAAGYACRTDRGWTTSC